MIRKSLLVILFLLKATFSYGQTRVIVIGFPEKNFNTDWKSKEKLAKKNSISLDKVDDLYRDSLLDAFKSTKEEIEFIVVRQNEEELFSKSNYLTKKNENGKEYFGTQSFDQEALNKVFDKYDADYIIHISQYILYMSVGLNLHTKIVHRYDYQLINRDFKIISADRFKFSGFFQGTFKPSGVQSKYMNTAKKISERLSSIITE